MSLSVSLSLSLGLSLSCSVSFSFYLYLMLSPCAGIVVPPIPRAVWLYVAISHFLAYVLDGIDGKQARRTKSSTPVGEEGF